MAGQTIILRESTHRIYAKSLIDIAPKNAVVSIKEGNRSPDQNAKMWAMLSDVSRAKPEGRLWTTDVWKAAFMHSLGHEIIWQQGLGEQAPFPAGFRTSRLNKSQMSDLIEVIYEYGSRHDVQWSEPNYMELA